MAVSFKASAAFSLLSQFLHKILEQDSGEITEYHVFSSMKTLSPMPIPNAPPDAPSPMIMQMTGTLRIDISYTTRCTLISVDNDADSCFDRMDPSLVSLNNRLFGLPPELALIHGNALNAFDIIYEHQLDYLPTLIHTVRNIQFMVQVKVRGILRSYGCSCRQHYLIFTIHVPTAPQFKIPAGL